MKWFSLFFAILLAVVVSSKELTKEEICALPSEAGPCRAEITTYFHNAATDKCETFLFGGCGGNQNKFDTEAECQEFCKDIKYLMKSHDTLIEITISVNRDKQNCNKEVCALPSLDGDGRIACAAYIPSWFHNSKTGQCEKFIYGGCGGNANRFNSEQECNQYCKSRTN
ncbi:BPTI/Kunitz domain-containing protein-like [Sitodiplosis mosellana]|uniref:BPTI/Kunitz domain-containing protein-like n=1 Tax=Sitodiplosis mosellana TaxID=263140 RepID=UPI00244404E1|nr:BPTI/Kunitz domain-containing protein-like [Sitodiplosis mosellana]